MIQKLKRVPWWGWLCGFGYFGLQYGLYRLANWLSVVLGTIDHAFAPKIAMIDDLIPVCGWFVIIYIWSYVFWIGAPIAASLTSKKNFVNYIVGLSFAYLVGFLIFTFMPTCMDRVAEGLMEIGNRPGITNRLLAIVYASDGSDMAFNLFPSYHCLISLYCYLGVRKQPEISKGFRVYSLIMAVLICMSTVLTKQHYVLDIVGGLSISVICYLLVNKWNPGKRFE